MSYDIRLVKPRPNEDPLVTAHAEADEDFRLLPPDPDKEMLKRRVASALIAVNPLLQPFKPDFEAIAKSQKISVDEAKSQYRHIELNGSDDGNGIQILLFDDEAAISVPYWHDGTKAEATFREIWDYLRIIQRETGYAAYDPQLGAILDLSKGYTKALPVYAHARKTVVEQMPAIVLEMERHQQQKKWWQFWKK
jgi:hypothetical protein